jgi:hypothetical protein
MTQIPRCASPLIANMQIFTKRHSYRKFGLFSVLSWQNNLKFGRKFLRPIFWYNFELEHFKPTFLGRGIIYLRTCGSNKSAKYWAHKSQFQKIAKKDLVCKSQMCQLPYLRKVRSPASECVRGEHTRLKVRGFPNRTTGEKLSTLFFLWSAPFCSFL